MSTQTYSEKLSTATLAITPQAAGAAYSNTPPPSASFEALPSDGRAFDPDTHGAVGPNHLMVALNSEVRIQGRAGNQLSRVRLDAWWAVAGPTAGATNVFEPRVVYDPYGGRFIFSANNDPDGPNPGLLLAVSATSDPTGPWHRRLLNVGGGRLGDSPAVGFNRHWIVLAADTYTNTAPFNFSEAAVYVFNKTNLYAGGSIAPTRFGYADAFGIVPVLTYDPLFTTNYLVSTLGGDIEDEFGNRFGWLALLAIGGSVTAPTLTDISYPLSTLLWADSVSTNLAPQLGSGERIYLGDSRITSATWRRGTIQAAHTIFLPLENPTRSVVQWWEFTEDSTLHQGQVDSGGNSRMYGYPSIAANRNNDLVVAFSRFSTTEYPSAAYAYREDAVDAANTLRPQVIFKTGLAPYYRTNSSGDNVWGNWSATMIDPLNDTDFWTIQEYAELPQGGRDLWGTWWARVSPPNDLVLTVTDGPDPVIGGSNLTYTITVTNLFSKVDGGRSASGVRISNSLPENFVYVSATASQGACSFSGGVVICDLGTLTNLARATATIVVRPNTVGTVQNTFTVHANGPDADYGDNTVVATTTVLPSADIEVLLAASQNPITVGNNLVYTLTVTNNGPAEATLVRLTNNLPASCTFVSVSPSIGTCTNSGLLVSCSLGLLATNATATVTITARPNTGGVTISNRTTVAASSVDPVLANNTRSILTYINAGPTISAIANQTINEDTSTAPIAFTIGDIETPAGSLQVQTSSSVPGVIPDGNVVLGGSGTSRTVTITPAPNVSGSSTITISVTDALGATTNRLFTVTVNAVNDLPTITPIGDVTIAEDGSTADIPFTIGDVETPVGSLTVTRNSSNLALVPVANITLGGIGADRTVRVTPATNQFGTATITVTVSDANGGVSNRTFAVTVTAVNDPPVITQISDRTVNEDTSTGPIAFNMIDVESGGTLTLSSASSDTAIVPINNVVFGGSGTNRTVTIIGATNQHGTVQITVTASDGSLMDSTTFSLTIQPVNDAPTLNALSNITTNEDAGSIVIQLGGISSGAANENQSLQITVTNSNPAVIESATVNYTSPAASGTLVLQTATNASGTSTISVAVNDGISNTVRSFVVTLNAVNDAPIVGGIGDQTIDEDTVAASIPFTVSDAETAAGSLTLSSASSHPAIVPVANITFGGSGANRTVTVRPVTNQFGTVTITVFASDGAIQGSNRFDVFINPINDAPAFVTPAADRSAPEDSQVSVPFVIGDVETPATDLTVVPTDSTNPGLAPLSQISITGAGANRSVLINPLTNAVGSTMITLQLSDGISQVLDTFVLTVTNINDRPQILTSFENQTITEDSSTAVIPFTIDDEETPGTLIVTAGSSNTGLVPVANIALGGAPSLNRTVQVTPAANQFGTATITVFVSDGASSTSNSFLLTVTAINDVPTISSINNVVANEDTATAALPFTIGDLETPAANLTLSATSSNPEVVDPDASPNAITFGGSGASRTVTIRPLTNQVGLTTITITVADGSNAVATTMFEVEFLEVNDRPSISDVANLTVNEDTNSVTVAFTIDDPETLPQDLLVTATSSTQALVPNANLSLGGTTAARTLTMVPLANQFGTTTITISVSDGVATNSDTFVLTVSAVNDIPTITSIADQTIAEDGNTGALAFTIDDVETAEASLTLLAASSNPTVVPLSGITFGGAGANRTVTVRPATNQFGSALITVTVGDGAASNSTSFSVSVTPVNDAPTINTIANLTISEDAAQQTVNLTGIGAGGTNENQALAVTAASSNPSLIPDPLVTYTSPQATGTLRFTPAANGSGTATITVTVDDGDMATLRAFTVTVNAINDPPTISNIQNITTGEDTPVSVPFSVSDVETADYALTLTGASSNTGLLANTNITFHGSGSTRTLVLVPTLDQFGTATVTVTVNDGATTANDTFVLTVIGTNDPPTLDPIRDVYVTAGGSSTSVTLTGISRGAANETQSLSLSNSFTPDLFSSNPSISYTSPNPTATLSFTPSSGVSGVSVITVFVRENTNVNFITSRSFNVYVRSSGNTVPTLSTITNRTTLEDTPISIPFVIGDSQTPANLLSVAALSTNLVLFPSNSFAFSGSGSNRTLTVTPAPNAFGSGTITVSVVDTNFGGRSTNFVLTVTSVNDLPVISPIPAQSLQQNRSTGPLDFSVGDVETPAGNLTVTATSSNPTLVPPAGIVLGGSGTNRAVLVTPATNQFGSATISVVVRDASSASATNTFTVTVMNTVPTPITIVRSGNLVTISWAISAGSFVLQARNSLAEGWSDVSGAPVPSGGQNTVTETITGGGRFYRLRSQ